MLQGSNHLIRQSKNRKNTSTVCMLRWRDAQRSLFTQGEVIRLEEQNVLLKQELYKLDQMALDLRVQHETYQQEKDELLKENTRLTKSVENIRTQVSLICLSFVKCQLVFTLKEKSLQSMN